MPKKYYWKINGYFYEVSEEQYYEYKIEQDRHNYLKETEQDAVILSLEAMGDKHGAAENFIPDPGVHIEDDVVHKLMLEKLRMAKSSLSPEEQLLIDLIYEKQKSQDEVSKLTGIPQRTVSYKLRKALEKLRKIKTAKNHWRVKKVENF